MNNFKNLALCAVLFLGGALWAEDAPLAGRDKGAVHRDRGFGPPAWRAFCKLPDSQRSELLALREKDMGQFNLKMRELGEQQENADKKEYSELRALVERYRASNDNDEKRALRELVANRARAHYAMRLNDTRRQLENMRRRADRLSEEIARREAMAEKVVEAHVEKMLAEGLPEVPPPPPPPHGEFKK